jgi:hypothetical protein
MSKVIYNQTNQPGLVTVYNGSLSAAAATTINVPANSFKQLLIDITITATAAANVTGTLRFNNNSGSVYVNSAGTAGTSIAIQSANTSTSAISSASFIVSGPSRSDIGKNVRGLSSRLSGNSAWDYYFNSTAAISSMTFTPSAATATIIMTVYGVN